MNFGVLDLFDWLKPMERGKWDLASSGVSGPGTWGELGIRLDDLPVTGGNFYGYPPLREFLASKFQVDVSNVAITPGASMANFAIMVLFLQDGGDVALEHPVYRPFPAIAEAILERPPIYIQRRSSDNYRLEPDLLFTTDRSFKLIVTTNLHNPSGVFAPLQTFYDIAERAASAGAWLLVDETFLPFKDDWNWRTAAALHHRIIATGSLTKAWGLSGLRIGWVIADSKLIYRVQRLMDYMHVVQPPATEAAALRILESPKGDEFLNSGRRRSKENLPVVTSALEGLADIGWVAPDGGVVLFVHRPSGRPTQQIVDRLLDEEDVLVQPGHFFGAPDGLRIGFAPDADSVRESMARFRKVWASELGTNESNLL